MLRFFPAIYPDELLYSAFCRYYKYSGKGSVLLTFHELYGKDALVFSTIDFPYNMDSFVNQFGNINSYTSEDIIYNFTMLPLFLPFLNKKMQSYAINSMKNEDGKDSYKKLGVMASSIKCLTNLKYCPACLHDDLQTYGEVYLHRSHNLDGIYLCYKHHKLLKTNCPICNVPISPKDKYTLNPLGYKCIYGHNLIESNSSECLTMTNTEYNHHLLISKIVHFILNLDNRSITINYDTMYDKYIFMLYKLDYYSVKGLIFQTKLKHDFISFYGSAFLEKLKLAIDCNKQYCWIKEFLSKKFKASHPLKHILFLIFLCNNNENRVKILLTDNANNYSIDLFGKGPWPCLNPIADHYLENEITAYSITISPKTKMPIGIFKCKCGFIYTKTTLSDSNKSKYNYSSIKAYGHVWEEKLSKIILYEGGSLRSIALKMHCDPKTVVRYAKKLGLKFCWESCSSSNNIYVINTNSNKEHKDQLCNYYGNIIQNYLLSFQTPPRVYQIRKLYEREYKYLYKYNKDLLFELLKICKTNACKSIKKSKVNWEERDLELFPLVSNEINQLLSSSKLSRITVNKIGRDLGITYILQQYLDRLPITKELINKSVESIDQYQIRRIRTINNRLINNNEQVTKTKIYRYAGLKHSCSDYVKQEVNNILNTIN